MKKKLLELSIEEFTRLLLNYEEEHKLFFIIHKEDGSVDRTETIKGVFSELYDKAHQTLFSKYYHKTYEPLRDYIVEHFFDYNLSLEDIDVYDYLDYKTHNFEKERIQLVLNEMKCFYTMIYCEETDNKVQQKYIERGYEIPKNRNGIPDFEEMRKEIDPSREFDYRRAINLLETRRAPKIIHKLKPKKGFRRILEPDVVRRIMIQLIRDGYIPSNTTECNFLYWFGDEHTTGIKPIMWIKKSSKEQPSKKSLLDLLVLMGYEDTEIKENINTAIKVEGSKELTAQFFNLYKDFSKIRSEYHNELANIVKKAKDKIEI